MSDHKQNYTDESIQVLEGLDAVRKRPGMYIGSTDHRGLHHLVFEIVDNAVDEVLAGYGQVITVKIHKDESISVIDAGRGMPTGMHKTGKPTPEVILTVLHAGGKFGQGGYKTSGGLHGVGASVVNALSEWLEVDIFRNGKKFRQRFENGGKPVTTLEEHGNTNKTGTKITFKADPTIFSTVRFQYELLAERLRETAFLLKGVKIELIDERNDMKDEFLYEEGLEAFVAYLNEEKTDYMKSFHLKVSTMKLKSIFHSNTMMVTQRTSCHLSIMCEQSTEERMSLERKRRLPVQSMNMQETSSY